MLLLVTIAVSGGTSPASRDTSRTVMAGEPAGPSRPSTTGRISIAFDYSAAERMVDASDGPALSEVEARATSRELVSG